MGNEFTPGPWRIKNSSSPIAHERVRILGADGESVASSAAYRDTKEAEANARLIAAAPAMYEALKFSLSHDALLDPGRALDITAAVLDLANGQDTSKQQ